MSPRFIRSALVAGLAITSLSAPALAGGEREEKNGFYATYGAGTLTMSDSDWDYKLSNSTTTHAGDISYDSDFTQEVGIGYKFGSIRGELTYLSLSGNADSTTPTNDGAAVTGFGDVKVDSVMASAYIDLPFLRVSKMTPYIGGGIGLANVSSEDGTFDEVKDTGNGLNDNDAILIHGGDEIAFGYQGKIGANFEISKKADLFGEATYAGADDVKINTVNYKNIGGFGFRAGVRYSF